MVRLCLLCLVLSTAMLTGAGCADPDAAPDARGVGDEPPDARRNPDFRDAGDCGGGSGTGSGTGCSGVTPDATPCDAVTFTYVDAAATSVWVTGSFTAWATMPPAARALVDDGDGTWSLTTQVGAGVQLYKLIIDGTTWVIDPANPMTAPDGVGGQNSVVETCQGSAPG